MPKEGLVQNAEKLKEYKWELPTDITLLDEADQALKDMLMSQAGWSEEQAEDFVMYVFHEALINAIAHGNLGIATKTPHIYDECIRRQKDNPTNKKVHVKIKIEGKKATVTILDEGEGYDYKKIAETKLPGTTEQTTGNASAMMQYYSDSIVVGQGGREITISKEAK